MVVRLRVEFNICVFGSEIDGVLIPLLPFSRPDDEPGAASLILH